MNLIAIPLSYLNLRSERGWPTYVRDAPLTLFLSLVISFPFWMTRGSLFFSKDGFLDKFSSFGGVLTGFYVAALIAIASVPSGKSDLDGLINKGAVFTKDGPNGPARQLTRRQYVCSMFGYLSFLSLLMSILSISVVSLSFGKVDAYEHLLNIFCIDQIRASRYIRSVGILLFGIPLAHMALTTVRGLQYLTDKIYVQSPKMLKRSDSAADGE